MKKLLIISTLIILCIVMNISCDTSDYEHDGSLAGSISYQIYDSKIAGTLDGLPLSNCYGDYIENESFCMIGKETEDSVSFTCDVSYGETRFVIFIPTVYLFGKPYDVKFDYISEVGLVRIYDNSVYKYTGYEPVSVSIAGWMNEPTGNYQAMTRKIAYPNYDCDIEIKCTIDGKELVLNITKMEGSAL